MTVIHLLIAKAFRARGPFTALSFRRYGVPRRGDYWALTGLERRWKLSRHYLLEAILCARHHRLSVDEFLSLDPYELIDLFWPEAPQPSPDRA